MENINSEKLVLFERIETTPYHFFITGRAGTGKSLLLQYFLKNTKKTYAVVAPTGVAAINVGGMTIHSLFKLPFGNIDNRALKLDKKTREVLAKLEVLVVDEISMVRVDVLLAIDYLLKMAKKSVKPFGGVQMIMFGDLFQLPPVMTDRELGQVFIETFGGYYFFHAPIWKQTQLEIRELKEVFRQKDEEFKKLLNAIRNGEINEEVLDSLNKRYLEGEVKNKEGVITLTATNDSAEMINTYCLDELNGEEKVYKATVVGQFESGSFPTEEELHLRVGAQIMMVKNDTERRWVNGTLGVITKLEKDNVEVKIGKNTYKVMPEVWQKVRYTYNESTHKVEEEIVGSFAQIPIRLAWAITIHKSQGQTYDKVVIDMGRGAFAHGQTYVALSRCKTLEGIFLKKKIQPRDIIVDLGVKEFMDKAAVGEEVVRETLFY